VTRLRATIMKPWYRSNASTPAIGTELSSLVLDIVVVS
jgi:hypothetical protein